MEAFNLGYGESIPLFTEEAILGHAGIAYGGQDTLLSELNVSGFGDFIILPVPEPSTLALAVSGLLVLGCHVWRRKQRNT